MLFTYKYGRDESIEEEVVNASSHGIGTLFSIYALIILILHAIHQQDKYKLISSVIFGVALILTYSVSTLYHIIQEPHIKRLLKMCDHMTVYLLIAGTYTPFTLVTLYVNWGNSLFIITWGLAISGILFSYFCRGGYEVLSLIIYLFMGWIGLIAIEPLYHALPLSGFLWLLIGGILYTVGIIFYLWHSLKFNHMIMHFFILAGSVCHFVAILYYVIK